MVGEVGLNQGGPEGELAGQCCLVWLEGVEGWEGVVGWVGEGVGCGHWVGWREG